MGEIVFSDQVELGWAPNEVFDLIASGGLPPWRLPLGIDFAPGVPISVPVTLPEGLGGQRTEVLGRVVRLERPGALVIAHELPWRGRIAVKIHSKPGGGSLLRLIGSVDEDLLQWATRFIAPAMPPSGGRGTWRLGLISSGSGPMSVVSMATRNMATLAVEEVNQNGGILGRKIQLIHGDDGSHPGLGAAELVRLSASGCDIVLANVTSATFRRLLPVARQRNVLLLHTLMNEGGVASPECFRLGERPGAQVSAAVPALMHQTGGETFFLAGSDYCWPRTMIRAARKVIKVAGGHVSDERYLPFGTTDFTHLIESIDRSGCELVVSTYVGADEVAFEQQMHASGVSKRVRTVSFALDESTHEFIGAAASEGLWTVFSYFQALDSKENEQFLASYRARFGEDAPPISSQTECVYEAVHLLARAAVTAGDISPVAVGRQMREGLSFTGPRGPVRTSADGVHQSLHLGESRGGRLSTVDAELGLRA